MLSGMNAVHTVVIR